MSKSVTEIEIVVSKILNKSSDKMPVHFILDTVKGFLIDKRHVLCEDDFDNYIDYCTCQNDYDNQIIKLEQLQEVLCNLKINE